MVIRGITALLAMAVLLNSCAAPTASPNAVTPPRVTGRITYLQRSALVPTAQLKVQLVDVSRMDAPAVVLGEQLIETGGRQPPFSFAIAYDPAQIKPSHSYAVQARIEDGGRLLFISDTHYAVLTRGAPNEIEMVLKAVGSPAPR